MATLIGNEAAFIDTLKDLIELDYDAVAAYQAAVDRLHDLAIRDQLGEFMSDHQRHIQQLSGIVRELGDMPPTDKDLKAVLTQGKVVIGQLAGDKGILMAMKSNEDDTNEAYERALRRNDILPRAEGLLKQNLADERRHRSWIENRLAGLR
jgi:uncharacterized protein (TIGR02284 family)